MVKKLESLDRRLTEGQTRVSMGMDHVRSKKFQVTAAELDAASDANPEHPIAKVFKAATNGMPPDKVLAVEEVDLQALRQDRLMIRDEEVVDGRRTITKTLGGPRKPAKPPPESPARPAKS